MKSHAHQSVSYHWQFDCLFNNLFKQISTSALLDLWKGNPPITSHIGSVIRRGFPCHNVIMINNYWVLNGENICRMEYQSLVWLIILTFPILMVHNKHDISKRFRHNWPLWGKSTGHRWIPFTMQSFDVCIDINLIPVDQKWCSGDDDKLECCSWYDRNMNYELEIQNGAEKQLIVSWFKLVRSWCNTSFIRCFVSGVWNNTIRIIIRWYCVPNLIIFA